jgi:hypothetical protein
MVYSQMIAVFSKNYTKRTNTHSGDRMDNFLCYSF